MRVLVTGGSGWVGRALVPELIGAGHSVLGLARSESSAEALTRSGAQVQVGSLDDLDVLRDAARGVEGVVHLAFKHDIAFIGDYAGASAADLRAIETLGDALVGTGRPLVIASGILGVLGLAPGTVATERDGLATEPDERGGPLNGGGGRIGNAHYALALANRGVRSVVVRLPPTVHGPGDNGFMATAVRFARDKGASAYIGNGANRWPAVHRDDAAHLFRLALESAPAGSVLHAVAERGVPIRDVAEAIASGLGVPAISIPGEQAGDYLGWLTGFWGTDGPASSALTRELVGWQPTGAGLLDDLASGSYFA